MAKKHGHDQATLDNRSRQLNQENDAYWRSRGEPSRPADGDGAPATPPAQGEGGQKPG